MRRHPFRRIDLNSFGDKGRLCGATSSSRPVNGGVGRRLGFLVRSDTRLPPDTQSCGDCDDVFDRSLAAAGYVNHLVLVLRFWASGRWMRYLCWLAATMVVLTASSLAVIRVSYTKMWGPDADPNGAYKHFAIDLFGMAVHLGVAALVVWMVGRYVAPTAGTPTDA